MQSEFLSERVDRYKVNECRGVECEFAHDGKNVQSGQTGNLREKKHTANSQCTTWQFPRSRRKGGMDPGQAVQHGQGQLPMTLR